MTGAIVMWSMRVSHFFIAGLLLHTAYPSRLIHAESLGQQDAPANMAIFDLLREETLNTVQLDRPIHFTTPQAVDTVAEAGTYQVEAKETSVLHLLALKTNAETAVDAVHISHATDIAEPVALYIKDDERFPHVVLLLPGGKGLDAVGSYDGTRPRSLQGVNLTPSQIKKALAEKLRQRSRK